MTQLGVFRTLNPTSKLDTARARLRIQRVVAATRLADLLVPPSHRLEALRGDRRGQYSLRINDQWRVCFRWTERGAMEIEIVDYH